MAKLKTRKGKKSREELFELTRRNILKLGAAAGTLAVIAPKMVGAAEDTPVAEPILDGVGTAVDIPHTPFVDDLPIPRPPVPKRLNPAPTELWVEGSGEAERAPHQRWAEFPHKVEYELEARAALHRFHSDFEPSYVWAWNGQLPGPTFLSAYDQPIIARFRNSLPEQTVHTGRGKSEITVHLHNGHHGSESDGFAGDFYPVSQFKDNHYVNVLAGYDAFPPNGDPLEAMHTLWYHDHREAFTANNNYLGLNGMYFLYDDKDPGHELNTPGSLRLPGYYGITDIPLILTHKSFQATANGRTELFVPATGGFPNGNKWVVNGKIQPKFTVRKRKYRFRILNTGHQKEFDLSLIDGTTGNVVPMTVVATDANFLEHPIVLDANNLNGGNAGSPSEKLHVAVAERYDVIVDFSQFANNAKVYLRENAAQIVGQDLPNPAPNLEIENVLMQFNVVERESWFPRDTPPIPETLTTYPTLPPTDASFTFRFTQDPATDENGDPVDPITDPRRFRVNGEVFDRETPMRIVAQGATEEWTIENSTNDLGSLSNWTHPVHIHFEEFRVLSRTRRLPVLDSNGAPVLNVDGQQLASETVEDVPVPPLQTGRKDVLRLSNGEGAVIKMQFRDFVGRYLIHCHNMTHEDDFMMLRWDIARPEDLSQRREEMIEQRRLAGVDTAAGLPTNKAGKKEGLS